MAMIAIGGYSSKMVTVDASVAKSLEELGFTHLEVAGADSAQISAFNKNVRYWYDGSTPTSSEGHPIFASSERIVRGIRNIQNLKLISEVGTATMAITLGTFGKAPA